MKQGQRPVPSFWITLPCLHTPWTNEEAYFSDCLMSWDFKSLLSTSSWNLPTFSSNLFLCKLPVCNILLFHHLELLWHWDTQSCLTQPPPLYAPVLGQVGGALCMWPKTTNGNWKPSCFTGAIVFCKSGIQRGISENFKLVCSRPYFSCLLCVDRTDIYNGPIPKSPTIIFTFPSPVFSTNIMGS
jgi:hypothetical protein